MPIFALVIGRMVNTLGKGGDPNALYGQLNDTTLFFLYLAIVSFFVCYLEIAMWMLTGAASSCMLASLHALHCQRCAYILQCLYLHGDCKATRNGLWD